MTIQNDPSARQQFRSMGELMAPASCAVCGNGTCDEGYIDLGVFIDYLGTLYLCVLCAKETASILGWLSPEEVASLSASANKELEEYAEVKKEVEKLNEYVDSLNTVLRSAYSPVGLSDGIPSMGTPEKPADEHKPSPSPFELTDGGESETKEPVKGNGRKPSSRTEPRITSD